jgi:hypothetical protein
MLAQGAQPWVRPPILSEPQRGGLGQTVTLIGTISLCSSPRWGLEWRGEIIPRAQPPWANIARPVGAMNPKSLCRVFWLR